MASGLRVRGYVVYVFVPIYKNQVEDENVMIIGDGLQKEEIMAKAE